MADMPFRSFFGGDPFRGFEELTGRVFGGMESWPPTQPSVQRVDVGKLLSASAREVGGRVTVDVANDQLQLRAYNPEPAT
ncbi:hypothetical protein ETD86_19495 [Nonomuraea turkmeniaca]|uniref:Uncharacterized protein n=1 Tax=Nonomuraea turkmeniaca TaxID=103838 RepID=A0A5S4FHU3_9ACTN|nr:hypothetical protein [Nonomuraea turkmeniaca]TMR19930.1 hypothetical protein ETD86_19495 [Nonomuraea turkmeniaca]